MTARVVHVERVCTGISTPGCGRVYERTTWPAVPSISIDVIQSHGICGTCIAREVLATALRPRGRRAEALAEIHG